MGKPKAVAAVRYYSELFTKHKVVPPSAPNDSSTVAGGLSHRQTAMIWHHTGSLRRDLGRRSAAKPGHGNPPAGPAARIARVSYQYNGLWAERTPTPPGHG